MPLKEQILAADDLPRERVEVPEWGVTVWVRTMTGAEGDAFGAQLVDAGRGRKVPPRNFRARLLVLTLCDESGTLIFNEGDITELGRKSSAALDRVVGVAMKLSGLRTSDAEEIAKNSDNPQDDASGSN